MSRASAGKLSLYRCGDHRGHRGRTRWAPSSMTRPSRIAFDGALAETRRQPARLPRRPAQMLARDRRPLPYRVEIEVTPPVPLCLLHELQLLARERQVEVCVGEVGRERRGIAVKDQGGLVLAPVMQHVRQVEARLRVTGFLLDRPLEAPAGFVRAAGAVVKIPQVDEGRDVFGVELDGALVRALSFGLGRRIVVQFKAAVEPLLGRLRLFPARTAEGDD